MLKLFVLLAPLLLVGLPARAARGAGPTPALTALVLPVDGPGLLPTLRIDLESGLREALLTEVATDEGKAARRPTYGLTSRDDTAAVLADAAGAGLACSLEDAACLVRVGVIAGVDEVFAPIAILEGTTLQLRITRVEVTRRRAVAVSAGPIVHPSQDGGATIDRVVDRLLRPTATLEVEGPAGATLKIAGAVVGTLPLPAPVSLTAGLRDVQALSGGRVVAQQSVTVVAGHQRLSLRGPDASTPEGVAASPSSSEAPPAGSANEAPPSGPPAGSSNLPLLVAGGSSLGLGALLLLGGGVGVVIVESGLSQAQPGSDQAQRDLGVALIGAAAIGTAVAVTGGVLLAVGLAP